jgi:heptaprenyl diphosphate synthase
MVEFEQRLREPWLAVPMARLEEGLKEVAATEDPLITEAARHLIAAGGKRIRPILSFAVARGLGMAPEEIACFGEGALIKGAIAVELVHLASLYHDDVMDEATERRGVASVNQRFGNLIAIVTGDFLLARAAGISARLSQEVAMLLADTLARMCEGQILEVASAHRIDRAVGDYLRAIAGKTASLIAAATTIPAMVLGLEAEEQQTLAELGEVVGIIFQARDDLLDLFADQETLRKLPGQDLVEGIYTLPVLLALEHPGTQDELVKVLEADSVDLAAVTQLIRGSGALARSLAKIEQYQLDAVALAARLPRFDADWILGLVEDLVASTRSLVGAASIAS